MQATLRVFNLLFFDIPLVLAANQKSVEISIEPNWFYVKEGDPEPRKTKKTSSMGDA